MEGTGEKINRDFKRKAKADLAFIGLENGKLPPQAVELEEAVLGALMLEKDALTSVIDLLKPECFYKEAHKKIYEAIQQLFSESQPVDILTVTQKLRSNAALDFVGGPYYISQLSNRVSSSANTEYHAKIILQKHIARELIRISSETIQEAYEDTTDVFDLLDKAETNFFKIADGNIIKSYDRMSTLVNLAVKQIEIAASQIDGGLTGVPSGFTEMDRLTNGWQKSDLLILAARPGMGKTAFVLSMARNMAVEYRRPVAIFSLEMSSIQLVARLISSETGLSNEKLKRGNLESFEWEILQSRIARLTDAPLFIDDTAQLSVFELRAKCRRLAQQHNIQCVIIDYLQLMTVGGSDAKGTREQEISTISRSLKSLAKELSIPVIALSQLSRSVEQRGGEKKPLLSDLRESGAIEQDADMVMFIYRPEYYGMSEDGDHRSTAGVAQIIVAKNRHGKTTEINLKFIDRLGKFTDLDGFNDGFSENGSYGAALSPNNEFDNTPPPSQTITRGSRMDDISDSDVPF